MKRFSTGLFSLAYAGSVRYFAAMLACDRVIVHTGEKKRKTPWCAHHCRVTGANDEQILTLPLVKPATGAVNTLEISEHGDWRRTHWGAVFSAFGKSPFFEYIADDLKAIYENREITSLLEFNKSINDLVIDFLDLPLSIEYLDTLPEDCDGVEDFRGKVGMSATDNLDWLKDQQYWQVWRDRHGFKTDQSILDLLMTNGREALFILEKMIK
jgi:hypothetical protein